MNKIIKLMNKLRVFIANHTGYEAKRKYLIKQGAVVGGGKLTLTVESKPLELNPI